LAEESILTDEFLRQLIDVGEADVLVGVPTYNNAATVGQVVQTIRAGLLKYFPRERAVIVNTDGGSRDQTPDLVRGASINDQQHTTDLNALRTLHCISAEYGGGPATGTALRTILASAELLRVSACAVVSPESTTMEPVWIERLLRPVYQGNFDFVTPLYRRHKFDGLLMRNLVYPMTRAFYGKQVREPYAAEFAFSGQLASHFLGQEIWIHEVGHTGTEIALTISAITGGFRLAQSFLGVKPHLDARSADLVDAMRQTVGALFWSLESNFSLWSLKNDSQPIPTLGGEQEVTLEPLRVNRKRLLGMFRSGVAELEPVLKSILSPPTLAELQRVAALAEEDFCYGDDLWARTVYEFAASYHKAVISRDHVIQALVPLYRGRAFTFLVENREASGEQLEENVENFCLTCERLKPSLLELWNGKK
jgi:glycosyltransferase involved in cell wall biosynthesis